MASPRNHQTPSAAIEGSGEHATYSTPATRLSPDQLNRWAELVAGGEVSFPDHLHNEDRALLVEEVQRRRRSRLVHSIARAIAQDILQSRGNQQGGDHTC